MTSNEHFPVMLTEAINYLNIKPNGVYVDMTAGRGGHSRAILEKLSFNGLLICIDQDDEAINYTRERLSEISSNFEIVKSNFRYIDKVLKDLQINHVDGFLFDLGVSSPQFDEDYRGFSYRSEGPLDMRMDTSSTLTAEYIVNNYSFEELIRIFKNYGEDKFSGKIAKRICDVRKYKNIETTQELVDIIKACKPNKELQKKGHPAKQIFQALRIEVNDELNVLKEALKKAINLVSVGGRVVVIDFQSLEDKIVKNAFKEVGIVEGNRLNFDTRNDVANYKILTTKPVVPSDKELELNRRSTSAKLRALERLR